MPAPTRRPGEGGPGLRVVRRTTDGRWSWLDVRLVPPAAVAWAVTLLTGRLGPVPLALAGGTALLLVPALLSGRAGRRRAGTVLAGCLAAVAAVCAVAAVRAEVRAGSPLVRLAREGAVAELVVSADADPRLLAGAGQPRVLLAATVTGLGSTGVREQPVLLFGPAADWQGVRAGESLRVRAAVRAAERGDDVVAVLSARSPPTRLAGPSGLHRLAAPVRAGLVSSAGRVLPPRPAALLPGLVVGDTSGMDAAVTDEFRRAGLAHLTAVSGANVAIVLTLVLAPLRLRGADRRLQALVAVPGLVGFVVLAGPQPSVLRAAAMGAVTLLALASGRSRAAVPALAAAVGVLLLVQPGLARDPGFALSVAATAAIVLVAPGWSRSLRSRRWPGPLADALAVSAAAGLATAPLVVALSGTVSLVSLPANLLAAPAVAPATVLGLLAALAAPVWPAGADLLTWLAGWPVRWLGTVAGRAAAVPDGAVGWPGGTGGAVLLAVVLASLVWVLLRLPRLRAPALAALLAIVLVGWPLRQVTRGWPPPETALVACDVGQGDALVLPTGPGEGLLVDAGPEPVLVDACLHRLGIDRLPLVLLSHLDADHAGGLSGALGGREVGTVATGTLAPTDERAGALAALVRRAGADRAVLAAGDRRTVGSAAVEVLAPQPAEAVPGAEPNDLSMVVRITQRGIRILFTGDLGADAERRIAARTDLTADVLKVPHHGSADADPGFLAATSARVAVISVGADNTYGHPTARLLRWLAEDRMQVHRTDRGGDVAVAGHAGRWGVAERGPDAVLRGSAAPAGVPGPAAVPRAAAVRAGRRTRVAAWPRGRRTPRSDVPAAGGARRGGTAPRAGGLGGQGRGGRRPRGRRGARAGGRGPPAR